MSYLPGKTDHNKRRLVKRAVTSAGKPLSQEEIKKQTNLEKDEVRKVVSDLVDQGEMTSTPGWRYDIVED